MMTKKIMYGHSTKISIMMDYGLFLYKDAEILKIMDFLERNYRIWKTTIKCLWLMVKNIMYGHSIKR